MLCKMCGIKAMCLQQYSSQMLAVFCKTCGIIAMCLQQYSSQMLSNVFRTKEIRMLTAIKLCLSNAKQCFAR